MISLDYVCFWPCFMCSQCNLIKGTFYHAWAQFSLAWLSHLLYLLTFTCIGSERLYESRCAFCFVHLLVIVLQNCFTQSSCLFPFMHILLISVYYLTPFPNLLIQAMLVWLPSCRAQFPLSLPLVLSSSSVDFAASLIYNRYTNASIMLKLWLNLTQMRPHIRENWHHMRVTAHRETLCNQKTVVLYLYVDRCFRWIYLR